MPPEALIGTPSPTYRVPSGPTDWVFMMKFGSLLTTCGVDQVCPPSVLRLSMRSARAILPPTITPASHVTYSVSRKGLAGLVSMTIFGWSAMTPWAKRSARVTTEAWEKVRPPSVDFATATAQTGWTSLDTYDT